MHAVSTKFVMRILNLFLLLPDFYIGDEAVEAPGYATKVSVNH